MPARRMSEEPAARSRERPSDGPPCAGEISEVACYSLARMVFFTSG